MTNFLLTNNEKSLMEFFWHSDHPLTSVDLIGLDPEKKNYIPVMIKSLLSKNILMECGTVLYGKRYARAFTPTLTREEYAAKVAFEIGKNKSSVSKITAALVNELPENEKLSVISDLEIEIKELKKKLLAEDL